MNLDYISGFFDADGSITLSKRSKNTPFKSISIDFTNTYINVLEEVKQFLETEYGLSGHIIEKPKKSLNHNTSYTLKYSYNNALELALLLNSHHPKKLHRINTVNKYYKEVTLRNGRYTDSQKARKLAFERLFFLPTFL